MSRKKKIVVKAVVNDQCAHSCPALDLVRKSPARRDRAIGNPHRPFGHLPFELGIEPEAVVTPLLQIPKKFSGRVECVATEKNLGYGGSKQSHIARRQQDVGPTATNQFRNEPLSAHKSGGSAHRLIGELNKRDIGLILKFLTQERRDQDCGTHISSGRQARRHVAHIGGAAPGTGR